MRILWLDINSSYSHSSVALPAIHAQVGDRKDWEWCVVRGTINDNPGAIAAAVAEQKPDVISATFWLFTHQMQLEVLSRVTALLDGVKIICGGPEFLGDNEDFLRRNKFVTAIVRGEGEEALPALLNLIEDESSWNQIPGLCWLSSNETATDQTCSKEGKPSSQDCLQYHDTGIARVMDFAALRYPEESSFFKWDKPFVQLETTRGCFNTCAFCVSGGEKPVRYQSVEQVAERLENICAHGIKDVRVLDRTFNYDINRACEMLDLFCRYEGRMRFHLEIHPSLISEVLKSKLASLPKGLLHLEAGIQSLDSTVLNESGRKGSLNSSLEGLKFLCSLDNLETHADLIAGLPAYSLEMLCKDIKKLVETGVDELQVESLKVLPGTQMRANAITKDLRYSPLPPYEILKTPEMSASELKTAMKVSRMIDFYYNSPTWQKLIRTMICEYEGFVMKFTEHLNDLMVLDSPLSLERRGVILYEYCKKFHPEKLTEVSIAWIEAGFSLKKEPAGDIVKIKNLEAYLAENQENIISEYGEQSPSHRYYLLRSADKKYIFGYDSEVHQPSPVFKALINDIQKKED